MISPRRASLALVAALAVAQEHHIPEQPIAFSHKLHVALPLKCRECHANPNPGAAAGMPANSKCMACHFSIAKDKPEIQKLKSFADRKLAIPWVSLYQIPDYVRFSHRAHAKSGFEVRKVPRSRPNAGCAVEGNGYYDGRLHLVPSPESGEHELPVVSRGSAIATET